MGVCLLLAETEIRTPLMTWVSFYVGSGFPSLCGCEEVGSEDAVGRVKDAMRVWMVLVC